MAYQNVQSLQVLIIGIRLQNDVFVEVRAGMRCCKMATRWGVFFHLVYFLYKTDFKV
jgi:hypothetical protein